MSSKPLAILVLCLGALTFVAPSATAQSDGAESAVVMCNPWPLGQPRGGVVGAAQAFGNAVIYGSCVLVVQTVDAVCVFLTGSSCLDA